MTASAARTRPATTATSTGGDGCAADCLTVDPGYSCTPPGHALPPHRPLRRRRRRVARAVRRRQRDRRGRLLGDLQDRARVEVQRQPEPCSRTTCGDRNVEGAEGCDDGNALPFDGCSATCQNEPDCKTANGSCTSRCGDGIVVSEAVRRRQQRRRRRLHGGLQDRARVHVHAAGAGRQDGRSGRLSRLPRPDARRLRAERDGADDGAHRDGAARAGHGRQARLRQRRQQPRHLRRDLRAVVPRHAEREPHDRRHAHALEQRPGAIREPLRRRTASSGSSPRRPTIAAMSAERCSTPPETPFPAHRGTLRRRTAPKWTRLA